jgi:cell division inhibitor SepF
MGVMNKLMDFLGLQEEEEVMERVATSDMDEEEGETPFRNRSNKGNVVVPIHSQKNARIILCEPRSYEEAQEMADHLRSRRSVLVNLQRVRADQAMRIVDFISGTVYALSGHIQKVGPNIFICTPDHIDLQGTITEILADEAKS